MALRALHCCVHSGEWIVGVECVIEGYVRPVCCAVTGFAGRRESSGKMIRICCAFEIGLVAAIAGCGQGFVVIVCMALSARNGRMGPRQREHCRMVKA
jgi:hypothetical protein